MTPDTVVRWHRQGWRLCWRWKSRARSGRPQLSGEVRELIVAMSRENRRWGTERIRGELRKLGSVVSNRSIRRYRWRGPGRSPSQTWRTFLRNHAHHLWAADLFTVPTLTFRTLCVLVFIAHGRRELVHVNVTANPERVRLPVQARRTGFTVVQKSLALVAALAAGCSRRGTATVC